MADGNPNNNLTMYVLTPPTNMIERAIPELKLSELEWQFSRNNTRLLCADKVNNLEANHQLFLM